MSDIAIHAEGIGKLFRIGKAQRYKTLRDTLSDVISAPTRAFARIARGGKPENRSDSTIWALRDICFEVKQGELVGIVGRNGAGKSTLLKILARITAPTEGTCTLRGRVGSLLEVGTGFHPELTGRENIYLNGAILGMRSAEIARKFDEIVAFSEVEEFLDTPVKHYSSGMYMRLAFAVAAHIETEILVVDEVLAVGDAEFQKKCLGKMGEVTKSGRTVLFVSHNMAAVKSLCETAIYIDHGRIKMRGEVEEVVNTYSVESVAGGNGHETIETRHFIVDRVICHGENVDLPIVPLRPAHIRIVARCKDRCPDFSLRICIEDLQGNCLHGLDSWRIVEGMECEPLEPKAIDIKFVAFPLAQGDYLLRIFLHSYTADFWDELPLLLPLHVNERQFLGNQVYDRKIHGVVAAGIEVSQEAIVDAATRS
jgi:ABC-type polysaccharide/polyol phosphate transport system ATPase subunit